jgi:predicted Zn-dependent protease
MSTSIPDPADASPPTDSVHPSRRGWIRILITLAALGVIVSMAWYFIQQARERTEALRLCQQGQIAEAEPLLIRALERNDADLDLIQAMARGYADAHKNEAAEFYLKRWRTLQPEAQEPRERLMDLLVRRVKVELTLERRELVPEGSRIATQQHEVLSLLVAGHHAAAEARCRQFLERKPASLTLRCLLAETCHLQGKNDEARSLTAQLLRERPEYRDALVLHARLYAEANEASQAIPLLRQVLARDRLHTTARYYLSQALAQTGQTAEAEREMAEMLRHQAAEHALQDLAIQPNNVALEVKAAAALLSSGRSDEGLRLLRRILEHAPRNTAARQLLAEYEGSQRRPASSPP